MAELDPGGVQVIATPTGVQESAPLNNPGIQLASALKEASPEVADAVQQVGLQLKAQAAGKAQQDVLKGSFQSYADAVRQGKIQPGQNPWYVQAFNQDAARIASTAYANKVVTESNDWAERSLNDGGVAYQARLQKEIGAGLEQNTSQMNPIDFHTGYMQGAQPVVEQAIQQNHAYNIQRIGQEHVQQITSLSTDAVMQAYKADPKATPEQIFQAMQEQHASWIATGGTEPQWRLIVRQAVVGAAANLKDSSIIDTLRAPYLGGEPIANQADETGKPVGLELDSDKFWIDRGIDTDLNQAMKARQAQIAAEGAKVDTWANQTYGNAYAFGKVPLSQLQEDGIKQGFSGQAIMWAADHAGEMLRGAAGYSQAQTEVYSNDPAVQQQILGLNHMAVTDGLTPQLSAKLTDMVGRQQLSLAQAEAVMDRAEGQTHFAVGEANSNRREAESLKRTDMSLRLQSFSLVGDQAKQSKAIAGQVLSNFGWDPAKISTKDQKSMQDAVDNAAMAVADKGPIAAREAADAAGANWVKHYLASHHKPGTGPLATLANPNR